MRKAYSFKKEEHHPSQVLTPNPFLDVIKLCRPHQWTKNLLIFLPPMLGFRLGDDNLFFQASMAFVSFCFSASAVYVFNDLMDMQRDQLHPTKRNRPLASGRLGKSFGIVTCIFLTLAAVTVGYFVNRSFLVVIGIYAILNLAYSLRLKRMLFADIILLSSLYVLRIGAGSLATGVAISDWFLMFSLFLFLSLAAIKRVSELIEANKSNAYLMERGRSYLNMDVVPLLAIGVSSSMMSLLIFAFYLDSQNVRRLYATPSLLWLMFPLFTFWMGRTWILANRGRVDADPIVFAMKDKATYLVVFVGTLIWYFAHRGIGF